MLSRETVLTAFAKLSGFLAERGVIGEVHLMGGAVMMLAFRARQATKDVDAIFAPAQEVRAAARRVAAAMGLDENWLNDGAKAFASPRGDYSDQAVPQHPNLRLLTPTPEYMLAMKVMAARAATVTERGDEEDIRFLLQRLGLTRAEAVMEVVNRYYANAQVLAKSV
jgi:hypothetical protein